MDYVDKSLSKGEKPHQVSNNLDTLKSWLRHFGLEIEKQIRLPASDDVDEIVPTKEQLSIVLRHADARTRVTTSLMAFSGLRPESIGNFLGSDGLRLDDLPELAMKKREAMIQKTPMIVKVRKTLSKSRHAYFSFLPQEGCQYLREYLELRLRRGERLSGRECKEAVLDIIKQSMEDALEAKDYRRASTLTNFAEAVLKLPKGDKSSNIPSRQQSTNHCQPCNLRVET